MWAGGRLRSLEALRRRRLRRLESLATSSTGACGPSSLWPPRAVAAAAAVRLGASTEMCRSLLPLALPRNALSVICFHLFLAKTLTLIS